MDLLAHEIIHFSLSGLVAFFFWKKARDWRLVLASFLVGFFIDVDHWFDYWLHAGISFDLVEFLNVENYVGPSQKAYIFFHGWEFIPLMFLIGKALGNKLGIKNLNWVLALSYFFHIAFDNFSFRHHPLAYFFSYRLLNGFSLKSFVGY